MDRLAAMHAFVCVVQTGSFSAAARQLRIGQPAVSKTVAQLEDRLGVHLLLRSTRGLTPTQAGNSFYERAMRAIEEADEAEAAARGAGCSLSGVLRISASVWFARINVVPRLATFLAAYPAVKIDVVLDDRNVDLIASGIDVALRTGSLPDSALTAKKIGQSRRRVLATAAYFRKHGEPTAPSELAEHEAIVYDAAGGGTVWTFRKGGVEVPVTLDGRLRITAAEGVRDAVLSDLGLAVAPESMFAAELRKGVVKTVLDDWTLPPMELWAVFATGRRASAKARAFVAFIEEALVAS
jgi:DNA-binding transcriptional LysR family regulator